MAQLEVRNISFSFGATKVLRDVSMIIPDGEFHALLGPSGSGKTTLLRIVAGFLKPTAGRILLNGKDITDVPPERRDIGIVFQQYALFPHLNIAANLAFGLNMRKVRKTQIASRVGKILELMRLEEYASRMPGQLSGGQKQRAALARALILNPAILLLDEPLSALDRKIRSELREELSRVHRETHTTSLLVTHDQEEALMLASNVVVLERGVVRQSDFAERLYAEPSDLWVASFVGRTNQFRSACKRQGEQTLVTVVGHEFVVPRRAPGADEYVVVVVRPEEISISDGGIPAVVSGIARMGATARIMTTLSDGTTLEALVLAPAARGLECGQNVYIQIPPSAIRLLIEQ